MTVNPAASRSRLATMYVTGAGLYYVADTLFGAVMVGAPAARGLSTSQIGLIVGLGSLALLLFDFPSGVLADRFGRRRTLVVALVLSSAGLASYAAATSPASYLAATVVWAAGMAAFSGTPQSWLIDELGPEHAGEAERIVLPRATAVTNALAALAGLAASGLIVLGGLQAPLLAGAAITALLALATVVVMPETRLPRPEQTVREQLASTVDELVREPQLRAAAIVAFVGQVPLAVVILMWQISALERGLPPSAFGVLLTAFFLVHAAGTAVATTAMRRFSPHAVCGAGQAICAAGLALVWLTGGAPGLIGGIVVAEIGLGMFLGGFTALLQCMLTAARRASHTSAVSSVTSLATVIVAPAAGLIAQRAGEPAPWLLGLVASLGLAWMLARRGASRFGVMELPG